MQARFLIPRAVSLAFGVMFATVISLVLVPTGYMIMEDLMARVRPRGAPQVARGSCLRRATEAHSARVLKRRAATTRSHNGHLFP